jgi:dihydroorotate dehydrogenase (NAD+) catalytic subunit
MVWQVHQAVNVPIIGIGGIMNARDAIEFLLAGASAVQVGTANFIDPAVSVKIVEGIEAYLRKNKIGKVTELTGGLRTE